MGKYFEKTAISTELAGRAAHKATKRMFDLMDLGAPVTVVERELNRAQRLADAYRKRSDHDLEMAKILFKARQTKQVGHA